MAKLAIHGGERIVPEGLEMTWPIITEEDKQAVMQVLDRGILWGPYAPEATALQEEWAEYVGTEHCLALNSGTAALHCAVAAAGIGPGDEVITSAFSFVASAVAVIHHNAVPIFVDIDPRTLNLDAAQVEARVTDRTKAILGVDMHGIPADWDELQAIADRHDLVLIEDACQAHGSLYKGRKTGTLGDMATFSLNSTKNLPGGEGGLFVTDDLELLARANMTRIFGEYMEPGKGRSYKSFSLGWHYRTQEMPAAFARSQLKRLDEMNANAVRNGRRLSAGLEPIAGVEPPHVPSDRTTNYHKYRVRLDPEALGLDMEATDFRDKVLAALKAEGVSVALWQTFPLPANPLFLEKVGYGKGCPFACPFYESEVEYDPDDYPETWKVCNGSLVVCEESYPIYSQKPELMDHYVAAFEKVFDNVDELAAVEPAPKAEPVSGRAEIV